MAVSVGPSWSSSVPVRCGFVTVVVYLTVSPRLAWDLSTYLVICRFGALISVSNVSPPKKYVSLVVPRQTDAPVALCPTRPSGRYRVAMSKPSWL
jgi:hypothetical protein